MACPNCWTPNCWNGVPSSTAPACQRRRKQNHLIEAAPFGRLDQLGRACNLVSSYRLIACTYQYSDWTYDPTANAALQRQTQHPTANVPSQRQTYSPTANATSANFSPQNVFYQHHSRYAKESYHDAWLHGFALGDVCVLDQSIPTHLNPED